MTHARTNERTGERANGRRRGMTNARGAVDRVGRYERSTGLCVVPTRATVEFEN